MKKLLTSVFLILLCGMMNAQIKAKSIPVTTSSKKALALYNEAMIAYQDVDLSKYTDLLSKALLEDPDFFMVYYQNAMFAAYLRQEKNFIKHATAAVNCKSKISSGEKILKDAVQMLLDNRKADLTGFGKKLVQMYPEDVNSYLQLMMYQYLIRDFEGEISTLNQALKLPGRKDYLYNVLAYAHMEKGQFKEAENALDTYISLSPQLPNPYDSKGDLYMRTKEYDKAHNSFMKAYSIDTTWGKAKALRAKSLDQLAMMQRFVGNWRTEIGKDSAYFSEIKRYGNVFTDNTFNMFNGEKTLRYTQNIIYSANEERFRSFATYPNGNYLTYMAAFNSDRKWIGSFLKDFNPNEVIQNWEINFPAPKEMVTIFFDKNGIKTRELKWYKVD